MLHAILQKEKGINKRDLGLTYEDCGSVLLLIQQDFYLLEEWLLRFTSGY